MIARCRAWQPPRGRYSAAPVPVRFEPDRPTHAQREQERQQLEDAVARWGAQPEGVG